MRTTAHAPRPDFSDVAHATEKYETLAEMDEKYLKLWPLITRKCSNVLCLVVLDGDFILYNGAKHMREVGVCIKWHYVDRDGSGVPVAKLLRKSSIQIVG